MPKILYTNPIGADFADAPSREWIDAIRSPQVDATVSSLSHGPTDLEYHVYEHQVFDGLLAQLVQAQEEGYSAAIIGCFYDGGLREARECLTMPVIGMGEATLAYAATLGHKFSIIVGRRKWVRKIEENCRLYGHAEKLASTLIVDMTIEQIDEKPELFFDRCIEASLRAVERDGAEVVVLSEYASPEFWQRVQREVPVPVLDAGVVSWKFAEMAAALYENPGYSHSKVGGYETPPEYR